MSEPITINNTQPDQDQPTQTEKPLALVVDFPSPKKQKRRAAALNPNTPKAQTAEFERLIQEVIEMMHDPTISALQVLNKKRAYLVKRLREYGKLNVSAWKLGALIRYCETDPQTDKAEIIRLNTRFYHAEMRLVRLEQTIKAAEAEIEELERQYIKAMTSQPGEGGVQ